MIALPATPSTSSHANVLLQLAACLMDSERDKISLAFEGLPPNPNDKNKKHWAQNAAATKQWRYDAKILALTQRARIRGAKALLHYHVSLGDQRRHDYDNVAASFKPVQDGLVDAGLLEDDTIDFVIPLLTFDREKPRRFSLDIYSLD